MERKKTPVFFRAVLPVLFLAALNGCATGDRLQSGQERDLDEAHSLYLQGSYEDAASLFTELIRSRESEEDDAVVARAYRFRGDCRMAGRQFGLARFDYDPAIDVAKSVDPPFPGLKTFILDCGIEIGDICMLEGAFLKADLIYRTYLDMHPPEAYRDSLLFRRYICTLKLGKPNPEQFTRLIRNRRNFDETALRRKFLGTKSIAPRPRPTPTAAAAPPRSPTATIALYPRSQWNARPIRSNVSPMTRITKITVHHTGDAWDEVRLQPNASRILFYQKIHQDKNGWADIGYHFIIDRGGRIWECRPLRYQGAHAGNNLLNQGNIGISLIGNYNVQRLTPAQAESLVNLLDRLCSFYGISPSMGITTHKEIRPGTTECPGYNLQIFMDQYRRVHS